MRGLLLQIVYGNWWIGLCALVITLFTWFELGGEAVPCPLLTFVLGATVVVYNLNMLSGLDDLRNSGTLSLRHHWCMANEHAMKGHLGAGVILLLCSSLFLDRAAFYLLFPAGILALLYVLPIIGNTKLREFGMFKIFFIATVWTMVTVGLPALQLDVSPQLENVLGLVVERWLFIFAITLPFDVRDLITDAQRNVRTIPSYLGYRRTLGLSILTLSVFCVVCFSRATTDVFLATLPGILMAYALVVAAHPDRRDFYYSFWLDGTMVVFGGIPILIRFC